MEVQEPKLPHISAITIILAYLTIAMFCCIKFQLPIGVSLLSVVILATIIALLNGNKWKDIEHGIVTGCRIAIIPVLILIIIGGVIASWMMGGIVPYLIYLGLKFLSPEIFLPCTLVICCITSVATGSSWNTLATVGIALLGVGLSLDISAPVVVGCIVSGSWFGDKMSPLSDSTNLAAGVVEIDLFDHIKHMMWTTIPALIIAFILYLLMSIGNDSSLASTDKINETMTLLKSNYHFGWWCLIPPILVIFLAYKKMHALPALIIVMLLGFIFSIAIESHSWIDAVKVINDGYISHTGNEKIDMLLSRGGIKNMATLVFIVFVALSLGGILETTRMLESLLVVVSKYLKSAKSIIISTLFSCWITEMLLASLYLSIIIPGRMLLPVYDKFKLKRENLSRTLEDGGTMISPLLPWGFSGVFVTQTLGVPTIEYLPYVFLNLFVPVFTILWAITGIGVTYKEN